MLDDAPLFSRDLRRNRTAILSFSPRFYALPTAIHGAERPRTPAVSLDLVAHHHHLPVLRQERNPVGERSLCSNKEITSCARASASVCARSSKLVRAVPPG